MKDSSFSRWMGPVGLLAVVAIFVGFGPLGGNSPDENASGVTVANWYNSHVGQSWGSIYAVSIGAALLIVFLVHLRTVLRQTSGESLLPNVAFVASVLLLAGLMVGGVDQVVLILAAHNHQFAIAHSANFISNNDEFGLVFGMALLTLSTGLCILVHRRAAPLPKTLGWYSVLVAIVSCAGPLSGLAFLFGLPIWVIATGFVITVKARRGTLGPSAAEGAPSQAAAESSSTLPSVGEPATT